MEEETGQWIPVEALSIGDRLHRWYDKLPVTRVVDCETRTIIYYQDRDKENFYTEPKGTLKFVYRAKQEAV